MRTESRHAILEVAPAARRPPSGSMTSGKLSATTNFQLSR